MFKNLKKLNKYFNAVINALLMLPPKFLYMELEKDLDLSELSGFYSKSTNKTIIRTPPFQGMLVLSREKHAILLSLKK